MRILFLPRYGPQGASSRYRIWQYVPLFEHAGHEVQVHPLLDDAYLRELYKTGRRRWWWLVSGYGRRLLEACGRDYFDAVICEQEIFPFMPQFIDLFFHRLSPRFFVDYDDAAQVKYSGWPVLRRKISRIMASAETVVVGNNYLASYAQQFTRRVSVIPTVVDLSGYRNRTVAGASDTVCVAWIGTPVTAHLLKALIPVMKKLQSQHSKLSFRFIGAGADFPCDGLRAETPVWSEQREAELLAECDIGIMPLPDNEFTRNKCGLKLIQYMACGLPVVASPVGVNVEIVEEGRNGYLASSNDEWFQNLDKLIRNPLLRMSLGNAGRAKVAAGYTLEHGFSKWQEILEGDHVSKDRRGRVEEYVG
jgi:glycosyltransferase involved in cell wall biosynthesis